MVVGDLAQDVELLVIGGGPGGYVAAIRAAQLGKEVVVVERERVGGVCLHQGCIPSKALIHAAKTYAGTAQAAEMGIRFGTPSFEMEAFRAWQGGIVHKLAAGVESLLRANGVTVVHGQAALLTDDRAAVETAQGMEYYRFEDCILATGSRPAVVPGFGFDGKQVLSSTDALELTEVPSSLLVIGGGYVGLELGTAFAKLGSQVTIAEREESLLPGVEPLLVQVVKKNLRKLGVSVLTGTNALRQEVVDGAVRVTLEERGLTRVHQVEKVLVTAGRRPNSEDLGLSQAGVRTNAAGHVVTDRQGRTNVRRIFAIGDLTEGPMLAHKAIRDGVTAAEAIAGLASGKDALAMPAVIFTEPEIATVGLTAAEAKERGLEVSVGKFPFAANGRALATGEGDGFCQVVAERASGVLLGVHMAGPQASNLIGEAALALEMGATVEDVHLTVHPHPTLTEVLFEAAADADGVAVHLAKRN